MAKKKTVRKLLLASMRRREAAFQKMTTAQKRVTIAKDVIAALSAKKIEAQPGVYIRGDVSKKIVGADSDSQVNETIVDAKCTACAIGSMFVCSVIRGNDLKCGEVRTYCNEFKTASQFEYLSNYFDQDQLADIESAFEVTWTGGGTNGAVVFGAKYEKDKDRMVAIMKNIVANNGKFKPGKASENKAEAARAAFHGDD